MDFEEKKAIWLVLQLLPLSLSLKKDQILGSEKTWLATESVGWAIWMDLKSSIQRLPWPTDSFFKQWWISDPPQDRLHVICPNFGLCLPNRRTRDPQVPFPHNHLLSSSDEDYSIKTYDEQEDSVYSIAWSPGSAWIFASISYSSNVIVNLVPNKEKLKILNGNASFGWKKLKSNTSPWTTKNSKNMSSSLWAICRPKGKKTRNKWSKDWRKWKIPSKFHSNRSAVSWDIA